MTTTNNQNNDKNKGAANSDIVNHLHAPKSVHKFLKSADQEGVKYQSVNLGLTLYRYQWDTPASKNNVPYLLNELSCFSPQKNNKNSTKGTNKTSSKGKNQSSSENQPKTCLDSTELYPDQMESLLTNLTTRTQTLAKSFPARMTINYEPQSRLILGADSDTPYSNIVLLKLHQLYGLPYLSANSLKGSLRNFWILDHFAGDEAAALKDTAFRQLFGASDDDGANVGALVFFDTFPEKFSLTLDIQTPHYPKYYAGSDQPTDTQNPVPIYLLCLTNCKFDILLACQDEGLWQAQQEKIRQTFTDLLTNYGLGAKTALGYGLL